VTIVDELHDCVNRILRYRRWMHIDADEATSRAAMRYVQWLNADKGEPGIFTCAWRGVHDEIRAWGTRRTDPCGLEPRDEEDFLVPPASLTLVEISWFFDGLSEKDQELVLFGPRSRNSTQAERASRFRRHLKAIVETKDERISSGVTKRGALAGTGIRRLLNYAA
jgi:hypothetical protein